jgi:hypothetical protein
MEGIMKDMPASRLFELGLFMRNSNAANKRRGSSYLVPNVHYFR